MNNCICIICHKPNNIWVNFLNKFTFYDTYIVIDDNTQDYADLKKSNPKIHFIQIPNAECESNYFMDTCSIILRKKITGWSKALYYFACCNKTYSNVWFFEDDIFFYGEQTIYNIDLQYKDADLLSTTYGENINGDKDYWHWPNIPIEIPPPYHNAMVCAIRVSQLLLEKIKLYADTYKTLFFLEALIPTICKSNNLIYYTPMEFYNIVYRRDYGLHNINRRDLYHPVKNMMLHDEYRNFLLSEKYE